MVKSARRFELIGSDGPNCGLLLLAAGPKLDRRGAREETLDDVGSRRSFEVVVVVVVEEAGARCVGRRCAELFDEAFDDCVGVVVAVSFCRARLRDDINVVRVKC